MTMQWTPQPGHTAIWNSACRQRIMALACLILSSASLSGCVDRIVDKSPVLDDYHARHPIVLANSPNNLDLFVEGSNGLDDRSRKQVKVFAANYLANGHGQISILMPLGVPGIQVILADIRSSLVAAGVRGSMNAGTYRVADPSLAAPIRLTYVSYKAKVANQCGEWPRDIASGSSVDGWNNRQYWNYGCSAQNMLATQVADPRDLVGPRAEQPADVAMRLRSIAKVREATDPTTTWSTPSSAIGAVGGK